MSYNTDYTTFTWGSYLLEGGDKCLPGNKALFFLRIEWSDLLKKIHYKLK